MADSKYGYFGRPHFNGIGSRPEERSRSSPSHVFGHNYKPIPVDAEGRKPPSNVVLPGNAETFVMRTETYVEEVHSSSEDEYHQSYTTEYKPVKHYARPNKHSTATQDRSTEVDKFLTKVQKEASRPITYPPSPAHRRQSHRPVQDDSDNDFVCHGDSCTKISNINKPAKYPMQHNKCNNDDDNYYDQYDSDEEPHMMKNHGWSKPTTMVGPIEPKASGTGDMLKSRPRARDGGLSEAMNDIDKAIEYFKEAVNFQSGKTAPNPKNTGATSKCPKRGSYTGTVDSREAARQYGSFRPRPVQEAYTKTINNRDAARKYNGAIV